MQLTLGKIAEAVGGSCPPDAAEQTITSVVSDSRQIVAGCLFVALKGKRFDGHAYIGEAFRQGAVAALVSEHVDGLENPQLVCADTRLAMGLLARFWRQQWSSGPLVTITGNSGKTTVKEITATLLQALGPVHATHGNLNNDFGVPLTLFGLGEQHRAAVVELGANHIGEIAWTSLLAQPRVAVITNVTGAHLGEFGGMGMIAQAKGEILNGVPVDGVAVLNRDDHYFPFWQQWALPRHIISFGFHPAADVSATSLVCDPEGHYGFELRWKDKVLGKVSLELIGRHNVLNALASAAVALSLDVAPEEVVNRLNNLQSLPGRLNLLPGLRGSRLLDDSYNANPGAVKAALETLMSFSGPRWCVLGAMGELGADSFALHAEVGAYAAALGVDRLITLGDAAQAASQAFGSDTHFDDYADLQAYLIEHLPADANLLIKGSRSAGMERLVAALRVNKK